MIYPSFIVLFTVGLLFIQARRNNGRKCRFFLMHSTHFEARCSSVFYAFAHDAMDHQIDPSK